MIYVTSDSHFGHDAIRDYSSRPFTTVEEMDATMIENWNAIVRDDGEGFHSFRYGSA